MIKLRVIYTPDERSYSTPKHKIISGKSELDALVNLVELYGIETVEELEDKKNDEDKFLAIILLAGEMLNLSFVQNVDTGKVYFDTAFDE